MFIEVETVAMSGRDDLKKFTARICDLRADAVPGQECDQGVQERASSKD